MNVFWIDDASLFYAQSKLASIYIKKNLVSPLTKLAVPDTSCHNFVLVAGVLDDAKILIWAKPGILKEDYIKLLESLYIEAGYVDVGFCWELTCAATKCMQHALSKKNRYVEPALKEFEFKIEAEQIEMDEF